MQYTVIVNGRSYDLPPKTLEVVEEMEKVSNIDNVKGLSIREKFQKIFDFVSGLVGVDAAKEILGSDDINKVDLSDVSLAFIKIVEAYDKPVNGYKAEQLRSRVRGLETMNIPNIIELAKVAQNMGNK